MPLLACVENRHGGVRGGCFGCQSPSSWPELWQKSPSVRPRLAHEVNRDSSLVERGVFGTRQASQRRPALRGARQPSRVLCPVCITPRVEALLKMALSTVTGGNSFSFGCQNPTKP